MQITAKDVAYTAGRVAELEDALDLASVGGWRRVSRRIHRGPRCQVDGGLQALAQRELDLQNRLAPVFEQYANARNQVERYRKIILPAAEEALALTRTTYSAGETNYTALLTAQRSYSQTRLNYLEAVRALRIAEVEIKGLLLRGSLNSDEGGDLRSDRTARQVAQPVGGMELFDN